MTTTTLLLIAILVIMVVAAPLVALLKDFLPAQVEKSANLDQNENRIYVLHSELHEHHAQASALTSRRNQRSAENARIDSEARKAEKTIREIENQPPLFVHEVGDPRANLTRFYVNLSLTKASGETRSAPVNPIWRCANVAEVWATTQEEAKQAVEVSFPFKLGYNKSFMRQPPPGTAAAAAAAPAGPPEENKSLVAAGERDGAAADGNAAGSASAAPASIVPNSPGRELRRPSMAGAGQTPAPPVDGAAPPPA